MENLSQATKSSVDKNFTRQKSKVQKFLGESNFQQKVEYFALLSPKLLAEKTF